MPPLVPVLPMVTSTPGIPRVLVRLLGILLYIVVGLGWKSREQAIWFGWRWIQERARLIIVSPGNAAPHANDLNAKNSVTEPVVRG